MLDILQILFFRQQVKVKFIEKHLSVINLNILILSPNSVDSFIIIILLGNLWYIILRKKYWLIFYLQISQQPYPNEIVFELKNSKKGIHPYKNHLLACVRLSALLRQAVNYTLDKMASSTRSFLIFTRF